VKNGGRINPRRVQKPMIRATEPTLQSIREKVEAGARLTLD
jgi:hypothetical protein